MVDAQFNLGLFYCYGKGDVERNEKMAVLWFAKAAKQGHRWAQSRLGFAYLNGNGLGQDLMKAVKWFEQAAKQGHVPSQLKLGEIYAKGLLATVDMAKHWLSQVVTSEIYHEEAQKARQILNKILHGARVGLKSKDTKFNGAGYVIQYDESQDCYRIVVEGREQALNLKLIHLEILQSAEEVRSSHFEAIGCYVALKREIKQSKEKSWNSLSSDEQAICSAASAALLAQSHLGHIDSMYQLGIMYSSQLGIDRNFTQALKWLTRAAEAGLVDSQCHLGRVYMLGQGTQVDYGEAVKWLIKASEKGSVDAKHFLGNIYVHAHRNYDEGAQMYRDSIRCGHVPSIVALGQLFEYGLVGGKRDEVKAAQHFRAAISKAATEKDRQLASQALGRMKSGPPLAGTLPNPLVANLKEEIDYWTSILAEDDAPSAEKGKARRPKKHKRGLEEKRALVESGPVHVTSASAPRDVSEIRPSEHGALANKSAAVETIPGTRTEQACSPSGPWAPPAAALTLASETARPVEAPTIDPDDPEAEFLAILRESELAERDRQDEDEGAEALVKRYTLVLSEAAKKRAPPGDGGCFAGVFNPLRDGDCLVRCAVEHDWHGAPESGAESGAEGGGGDGAEGGAVLPRLSADELRLMLVDRTRRFELGGLERKRAQLAAELRDGSDAAEATEAGGEGAEGLGRELALLDAARAEVEARCANMAKPGVVMGEDELQALADLRQECVQVRSIICAQVSSDFGAFLEPFIYEPRPLEAWESAEGATPPQAERVGRGEPLILLQEVRAHRMSHFQLLKGLSLDVVPSSN